MLPLCVFVQRLLSENEERAGPGFGAFFSFVLIWLVGAAVLTASAGSPMSWYAPAFLPIWALFTGGALNFALGEWRFGRRFGASLVLISLALSGVAALRFSPALHRYEEWQKLSRRQLAYLERFEAKVAATAPGEVAFLPGAPFYEWRDGPVGIARVAGIADYGLRAYAELALPGYRVRVDFETPSDQDVAPTPGVITIRIAARPPRKQDPARAR